jgi:hypothetical protein
VGVYERERKQAWGSGGGAYYLHIWAFGKREIKNAATSKKKFGCICIVGFACDPFFVCQNSRRARYDPNEA